MQDLLELSEFSPLTASALGELLEPQSSGSSRSSDDGRRALSRWPFPATVELWVLDKKKRENYTLATCMNLSAKGIGIRSPERLVPETNLAIAIHQPEKTLYGHATVRHCTELEDEFYVGLEFQFDKEPSDAKPVARTRPATAHRHTRAQNR